MRALTPAGRVNPFPQRINGKRPVAARIPAGGPGGMNFCPNTVIPGNTVWGTHLKSAFSTEVSVLMAVMTCVATSGRCVKGDGSKNDCPCGAAAFSALPPL